MMKPIGLVGIKSFTNRAGQQIGTPNEIQRPKLVPPVHDQIAQALTAQIKRAVRP